jgi:hypothetical protein
MMKDSVKEICASSRVVIDEVAYYLSKNELCQEDFDTIINDLEIIQNGMTFAKKISNW